MFNDFWDAKSTSKADLRYFRKTFKTMIGVIDFKGPSVSETIKSDPKHLKTTRMRFEPTFFLNVYVFS